MTNSRTTKKALLSSALALTLCVAMLIATTFAWFTDTASTSVNKIQAGTLDVALEMAIEWNADGSVKTWSSAEGTTLQFKKASDVNGTEVLWEPGCTYSLPELHVVNKGNLALKYKILITGIQGDATLNEAITWTMKNGGDELDLANNEYQLLAQDAVSGNIIISGHMKEDAGNKYQGLSIDGIAITVVATQLNNEYDSEGNEYDKNALYPEYVAPVNSNATGNLTVNSTTSGAATTVTVRGDSQEISDSVMSVTYPEGVILNTTSVSEGNDGTKKTTVTQSLKYVGTEAQGAGVTVNTSQSVASYDLTLPVADENTTLVTVKLSYTIGLKNVVVYHNGKQLGISATNNTNEEGEYFTYNSENGTLVLYLKHASPIDIVYDKPDSGINGDILVSAWELQNVPGIYDATTETLTIPKGIKSISSYILCEGGNGGGNRLHVKKLVLPDSLETIGNEAFYAARELEEIVWPENCKITHIGNGAFNYCDYALTEITIPGSVKTMGLGVFANCKKLEKVSGLPEAYIKNVPQSMFGKCPLVVNENQWLMEMETIGVGAFGEAFAEGETLDLSEAPLTSIAQGAFSRSKLSEVKLPSTLTSVGAQAFFDCDSLKKVTLPASEITYPNGASDGKTIVGQIFRSCDALETVEIPSDCTAIAEQMFYICTSLKEVNLPSSLTSVGAQAFDTCTSLEKVTLAGGNTTYGDKVFSGCSALETVIIPEGCTTIGSNMFKKCNALTKVDFPSTLKTVGDNAFKDLEGLKEVKLAAGDTDYGTSVFQGCDKLSKVTIPEGCTTIGNKMFYNCKGLTSIGTLPSTLTTISEDAFRPCTGLNSKVFIPSNVETIGKNAFRDITDIQCAAASKPNGWDSSWNNKLNTVTWNKAN